jgi:hypothetical protein
MKTNLFILTAEKKGFWPFPDITNRDIIRPIAPQGSTAGAFQENRILESSRKQDR